MAILLYKLFVCLVVGVFWYGAYDAYKHTTHTKGAKTYMVFYSCLCALMILVVSMGR